LGLIWGADLEKNEGKVVVLGHVRAEKKKTRGGWGRKHFGGTKSLFGVDGRVPGESRGLGAEEN